MFRKHENGTKSVLKSFLIVFVDIDFKISYRRRYGGILGKTIKATH